MTWKTKSPADLGLDDDRLEALAKALGSRGCVIKNGYVVKAWGAQDEKADLFSSAKPVLSTLLMFAVKEGRSTSFDQPVLDFGWPLSEKDRRDDITTLGQHDQRLCSPRRTRQGVGLQRLRDSTLSANIVRQRSSTDSPEVVFHDPKRFGALQLEDGFTFRRKNRRMTASVRDFARIAWFWLNRGNWNGRQLLPQTYFNDNMRPQVPKNLALSSDAPTNDYLKIGSYGGESNHFSTAGPGIYGFNWWFNSTGANHPRTLTWPDAPPDTVMSLGHRGNCSAVIPSLNLVVVATDANWGEFEAGKAASPLNQILKLVVAAGTPMAANQDNGK